MKNKLKNFFLRIFRRLTRIEKLKLEGIIYKEFMTDWNLVNKVIFDNIPLQYRETYRHGFSEFESCWVIYSKIRENSPTNFLEVGSYIGLSSLLFGLALRRNFIENPKNKGILYSISLNCYYKMPNPLGIAFKSMEILELHDYVNFIEGSSIGYTGFASSTDFIAKERNEYFKNLVRYGKENMLAKLIASLGKVDMIYLDGMHQDSVQMIEIVTSLGNLTKNGSIFVDDVIYFSGKNDLRNILIDIFTLNINLVRFIEYIRLGCRNYNFGWLAEAFRFNDLAVLKLFKVNKLARVIEIQKNDLYLSVNSFEAPWFESEPLDQFKSRNRFNGSN
jgi:hypothetical protein